MTQSAKEQNRSINAEIIARLEKSFETPHITNRLLEETVLLTLKAVKDDPNLLNNPKVSSTYLDNNSDTDRVELVNANIKAP